MSLKIVVAVYMIEKILSMIKKLLENVYIKYYFFFEKAFTWPLKSYSRILEYCIIKETMLFDWANNVVINSNKSSFAGESLGHKKPTQFIM